MELSPNLQMARDHLELIGTRQHGYDGKFVFVLIHDARKVKTRQVTTTLSDALPTLKAYQAMGYGVFVIPQATRGRKVSDITRVRSLAYDLDDGRPVSDLKKLPLTPSAILKTPRGWHVYYEASEDDPVWTEVSRVSDLHRQLGRLLGADRGALNLAQPMRLAGFFHLKGEPTMVTLERLSWGSCRTFEEVARSITYQEPEEPPPVPLVSGTIYPFPILRYLLRQASHAIQVAHKGTRFAVVRRSAFRLGCYIPYGLDAGVAKTTILRATATHQDPEFSREVEHRLAAILADGQREGLRNPPTPPPSLVRRLAREKWASDLVGRMQWDRVVVREALQRHPAWKPYGTQKQAEHALGKALRAAGYTVCVIREGKPKRIFLRDASSLGKVGEG